MSKEEKFNKKLEADMKEVSENSIKPGTPAMDLVHQRPAAVREDDTGD